MIFRCFMGYSGFGFKSLAILSVVLQITACSLDENSGAAGGGGGGGGGVAVSVSWTAPAQREDGSPLSMSEIAGYRIYYGTKEGSYPDRVDIDDGSEMQGLVNAKPGVYYVVVTAYDVDGRESAFSSPPLKIEI